MKKLLFILILLLMHSCHLSVKPINIFTFLVFVESEGDFFKTEPLYDETELLLSHPHVGGNSPFYDKTDRNGFYQFTHGGWAVPLTYLHYGNGDIDTLTISWEPKVIKSVVANFKKIKMIKFHLNGDIIEEWDFKNHPELMDSIRMFNSQEAIDRGLTNEIVIRIPKSPDMDEIK